MQPSDAIDNIIGTIDNSIGIYYLYIVIQKNHAYNYKIAQARLRLIFLNCAIRQNVSFLIALVHIPPIHKFQTISQLYHRNTDFEFG